jgi:predicted lactoylglutathione lyase
MRLAKAMRSKDARSSIEAMNSPTLTAHATPGRDAIVGQHHEFMYGTSFFDLDHHHWELFWMDKKAMQLGPQACIALQQK